MKVRYLQPARGWFALYAVTHEPFCAVKRVVHWAVLSGDSPSEEVVGLVLDGGRIVPAPEDSTGPFFGYYNPDEQQPWEFQPLIREAQLQGQRLYLQQLAAQQRVMAAPQAVGVEASSPVVPGIGAEEVTLGE